MAISTTPTSSNASAQEQINAAARAKGMTPKEFEDTVSKLMQAGNIGKDTNGKLAISKKGGLDGDIDGNGNPGDKNDVAAVARAVNQGPAEAKSRECAQDAEGGGAQNPNDIGPNVIAEATKQGVSPKAYNDAVVDDLQKHTAGVNDKGEAAYARDGKPQPTKLKGDLDGDNDIDGTDANIYIGIANDQRSKAAAAA
jgi:hypothetical protein